ncbi:unnamed protein product [marine sediment metagenome]|uniref:Uncharacterized protein n=1 Tax=marine sediment metagenome TaxID=412755 RepID=X0ZMN3_9ZZZZ
MVSVEDIKSKYNKGILKCQKLYAAGKPGATRSTKGKIVEDITKDIIGMAWSKISSDINRLKMDRKKVIVKTNDETYKLSQDIHVYIDNVFKISVECKSYTEVAMYKKILFDSFLMKETVPTIDYFFLVQLENFMRGDYGKNIEAKGESESVITLNRLFPDIDIIVITLLDEDREIKKPIHIPEYFKPLRDERINYAIEKFKEIMLISQNINRERLNEVF